MARSAGAKVGMPPHRVRHREPLQELGHVGIGLRPHNKVPMIGHQRVSENPQRSPLVGFFEHSLERLIIGSLLKDREPGHRPIEAVEHHSGRANALGTRHAASLPDRPP